MQAGDNKRVWATQSWDDNWNNVIRNVLFEDEMLKDMMMIPSNERNNMLSFRDRYFIRDAMVDNLVTDEKVRIVYADSEGAPTNIPQLRRRYIEIDVYVKHEYEYSYSADRLQART